MKTFEGLSCTHWTSVQACQPANWSKLKHLCELASHDPKTTAKECYATDGWLANHASILWQVKFFRIHGLYMIEDQGEPVAMASYSLHGQVMLGPRRTYVKQGYRGGNILAKLCLGDMFQLAYDHGASYVVMSFNTDQKSVSHFDLHVRKDKRFLGENSILNCFEPVSDSTMVVMGVPQLCLYMKLTADALPLEPSQVELALTAK